MDTSAEFEHHVIGAVHEVRPTADSVEALRAALEHETGDCHALRVVIDLTATERLGQEQVDVMIELIDPHDERWMVRVHDDADPALISRLREASLDGHLISDADPDHPTRFEAEP